MIKIFLLDFSRADGECVSPSALPAYIRETKNPTVRRERIFSYLLLKKALLETYGFSYENIKKDEFGRPYVDGVPFDFSISHSYPYAAVAVSDSGRVGIDIQRADGNVSERLKKYIKSIVEDEKFVTRAASFCVLTQKNECFTALEDAFIIKNESIDFFEKSSEYEEKNLEFFSDWTLLEAIAKADGRGLLYIKEIISEKNDIEVYSSFFKVKDSIFSLTVANTIKK